MYCTTDIDQKQRTNIKGFAHNNITDAFLHGQMVPYKQQQKHS